jgi:pyruvate/2-oxoglutarate dehydrogenase complex dihydrolipoamide dehydrogenase (E3) component
LFWKKLSYNNFSAVTYTNPQVATFGRTKAELEKNNIEYKVVTKSFAKNDRAITDQKQNGLMHIFLDKKQKILGGSVAGPDAGELIQELALLMHLNKPLSTLINKTYAYPTLSRLNKELAFVASHDRLTSRLKKLLRQLFSLFNQ